MQFENRRCLVLAVLAPAALLWAADGVSTDPAALSEEPPSVTRLAWEANRDSPVSPDLIGANTSSITSLQPRPPGTELSATIFGYLPYWESAANIRWDLLTHIACFSVQVNYNGTFNNLRGWPWTSVINTAHQNGVKVVLVATLFTPSDTLTLITTPSYKNAFFVNIKNQMLAGEADGLNIDFEGTGEYRSHINGFMADLTAYLHAEIPGCEVTFAGPAVNWSDAWDLPGLAASCDGIFIMGYAFNGSWSTYSGPEAPLTGGSRNITTTVTDNRDYGLVTQNNPEKLILGLPYYGEHWTTQTSEPRSKVIAYQGSTRFRDTQEESQVYGLLWDSVSQTPWYRWHDGSRWHQVWADNAESLGLKYQLAQDHDLQGVGMWALNYDGTRPELWDELEQRFRVTQSRFADFDGDGDVDIEDFSLIQRCLTENGSPQSDPECDKAVLDDDGNVDEQDIALFLNCFGGPGVYAGPDCTDYAPF